MVGDLLRDFQLAAVLQIRRDAGRAEGMIANPRFDAGCFRPPADDAVGVLLEEGICGKLAGLGAGGAEEIAVEFVGDAGRFDIIVQRLIETMMPKSPRGVGMSSPAFWTSFSERVKNRSVFEANCTVSFLSGCC
jgi:hypothetical protein